MSFPSRGRRGCGDRCWRWPGLGCWPSRRGINLRACLNISRVFLYAFSAAFSGSFLGFVFPACSLFFCGRVYVKYVHYRALHTLRTAGILAYLRAHALQTWAVGLQISMRLGVGRLPDLSAVMCGTVGPMKSVRLAERMACEGRYGTYASATGSRRACQASSCGIRPAALLLWKRGLVLSRPVAHTPGCSLFYKRMYSSPYRDDEHPVPPVVLAPTATSPPPPTLLAVRRVATAVLRDGPSNAGVRHRRAHPGVVPGTVCWPPPWSRCVLAPSSLSPPTFSPLFPRSGFPSWKIVGLDSTARPVHSGLHACFLTPVALL